MGSPQERFTMTTDNWAVCPKCEELAKIEYAKKKDELEKSYGVIPQKEYEKLLYELSQIPKTKRGETLREYYEITIDKDGVFRIDYTCHCDRCGFNYIFSHSDKISLK